MNVVNIKILAKDDEGSLFTGLGNGKLLESKITDVGILEAGMESGKTSVSLLIPNGDGNILVQISAGQFEQIAAAVRGAAQRFGEIL